MLSRRLLRIKAVLALYSHLKSESDNLLASEKTMLNSVDKAYDLYLLMMNLPVELAAYAKQKQEQAKQKHLPTEEDKNPNTKFVDNAAIALIESSDSINDLLAQRKLSWDEDIIKVLYRELLESKYYQKYMSNTERSLREDISFLEDLYVKGVQHSEALDDYLEQESIMWMSDLCHVMPSVMRTLSMIRPSHTELRIMPKFKSEDDLEFVRTLFQKALINYKSHQEYIDKFTSNWDVDRIVYMDNLLIVFAMTEFLYLDSVPVKVTLDEYIELSKIYSTPGSSTFVNGVLDKISISLREEGRINKSGRGLM